MLAHATSKCWTTFNVDFTNTCRIACPTYSIMSNPVGLWLSPPIKTPPVYVFPPKINEKCSEIQFFAHFCDSLRKREKIGFWTGHRPVLIFLLWERRFGAIFGHFGVGGILKPFWRASGHSSWAKRWLRNFSDAIGQALEALLHDGKFKHFTKTKPSITHTDRKPDSLPTMWTLHQHCSMLALLIQKFKKVDDHGLFVWTSMNPPRSLIEIWNQMHVSYGMVY